MSLKSLWRQQRAWTLREVRSIRRKGNKVPGTGVCYVEELSGPDGVHVWLVREKHHTDADMQQAKRAARNHWDVTGFTILKA